MERRLALTTASAAAATLGIATVCFAAVGGGILGFGGGGGAKSMTGITEVRTITRVVVVTSNGSIVTDPAGAPVTVLVRVPLRPKATTPPARAAATPTGTVANSSAPTTGTTIASPSSAATTTAKSTTTSRSTTTTTRTRSTTTTVRASGPTTTLPLGVPADWPVGKPIPPMPVPCPEAQLQLNGVWTCG